VTAPKELAISMACEYEIGVNRFSLSLLTTSWSSFKSDLLPTKIQGVLGQWCIISGIHYVFARSTKLKNWDPSTHLWADALEGSRAHKRKFHQEHISLRITQRSQPARTMS